MSHALGLAAFEPTVDDFAALGKRCREYMKAQGIARTEAGAFVQALPFHYPRDKAIFEAQLARHRRQHLSHSP